MKILLKIVVITLILSIVNNSLLEAQVLQGCRKGGVIYTSSFNFFGTLLWSGGVSETCPASASSATQYAGFISNASPSSSCVIGFFVDTGTLVNYSIYNCPLDEYIWTLIVVLGGMGFLYLRKHTIVVKF